MGIERERKYLVRDATYRTLACESHSIRQGYLQREPERVVRVRTYDGKGYITVKGKTDGCSRLEFEYEVPYPDAVEMLGLCTETVIEKVRYIVWHEGMRWEVDEFGGKLAPLVMAEIELTTPEQTYPLPDFVGQEVTGNPRYYNSNL